MITIQEYIERNLRTIQNFSQQSYSWEQYRNIPNGRMPAEFRTLLQEDAIPEPLHRDWVIQQFNDRNTYYQGFVAAMLWGGINATRPAQTGRYDTTNFYKALSKPRVEVTENIEQTRRLIASNKIHEVYNGYLSGHLRIPGVGESFFTKLLFFAGMNTDNPVKPLIYDKWTKIMHVWILLGNRESTKLSDFFSNSTVYKNVVENDPPNLMPTRPGQQADSYQDYILLMNQLANHYGLEPSNLEAYLFGKPMKNTINRDPLNNPRPFMVEQIRKGWQEQGLPRY